MTESGSRVAPERWARPSRAVVHVFLSSPGDCATLRDALCAAIARVDQDPRVVRAGIAFRAVRWEDFPGGMPEGGSAQGRIDALLERYDLKRYEIYLGLMKDRIGTPTPDAPSGTVAELRAAETGSRRGSPSEIWFYFVGATADSKVTEFRAALDAEKFLYHAVRDDAELLARVEVHLIRTAEHWNDLARRLRRAARRVHQSLPVLAAAAVLAALGWIGLYDLPTARALEAAGRRESADRLLERWQSERSRTLLFRDRARRAVAAGVERAIAQEGDLGLAKDQWQRWRTSEACDAKGLERAATELVQRLDRELEDAALFAPWESLIARYRAFAEPMGIARAPAPAALRALAARALFDLVPEGAIAPLEARAPDFVPLERRAVAAHAEALARREGSRVSSPALAPSLLFVRIDARLRDAATRAWREEPGFPRAAITAFVAHGEREAVIAWLDEHASPSSETYLWSDVMDGARQRRDALLSLALLDRILAGRLPAELDVFAFATEDVLGVTQDDPIAAAGVAKRCVELARSRAWPSPSLLEALVRQLDPAEMAAGDRAALRDHLEALALAPAGPFSGAQGAILAYLARDGDPEVGARLALHVDRAFARDPAEVSMDWLEALDAFGAPTVLDYALALAADARARSARAEAWQPAGAGDDCEEQTRYLTLLQRHPAAFDARHRAHVEALVLLRVRLRGPWSQFRLPGDFGVDREDFRRFAKLDRALGAALAGLPDAVLAELFRVPPAPDPAAEFDGRLDRWLYLLDVLATARRALPQEIVAPLVGSTPASDRFEVDRVLTTVALLGGDAARDAFAATATVRPAGWLRYVAYSGGLDTIRALLPRAGVTTGAQVERFVEVLEQLDESDQRDLFPPLRAGLGGEPLLLAHLLPSASRLGMSDAGLLEAAELLLSQPFAAEPANLGTALGYLDAIDPERCIEALGRPSVRGALQALSPFHFAAVLAEIDWSQHRPLPRLAFDLGRERPLLSARAIPEEFEADPRAFELRVGPALVGSELQSAIARFGGDEAVPWLLDLANDASLGPEVDVPDPAAALRAYALWLAALALERGAAAPAGLLEDARLLEGLASTDAALRRAAAALVLALVARGGAEPRGTR